jgi:hypothetical protein
MGQYYKPAILGKNKKKVEKWLYSHDFDSGLKLMEHSWVENPFVKSFERLIVNNPQHVVWAGDYADVCKGLKTNVYDRCKDSNQVPKDEVYPVSVLASRYIINHTKKEFVDKTNIPDNDGWYIHPLPLLTCEGNGRGGGDYRCDDKNNIIGSWARDLISVNSQVPEDYKELFFDLIED